MEQACATCEWYNGWPCETEGPCELYGQVVTNDDYCGNWLAAKGPQE